MSFLPWLRDEFVFRCVYCLRREQWDRSLTMEVEHFLPTSQFPDIENDYENLLYACPRCNRVKGMQIVPSPEEFMFADHVAVQADGTMIGQSPEALRVIAKLRLNSPVMIHFRRTWFEIVALANRFEPELFQRLMGFPDDLPNLQELLPPDGNSRPDGIARSHNARRNRGELPTHY